MYRNSEIREIELGAKDAIIHRKVEKKEEYAVIEWDGEEIERAVLVHRPDAGQRHRRGRLA